MGRRVLPELSKPSGLDWGFGVGRGEGRCGGNVSWTHTVSYGFEMAVNGFRCEGPQRHGSALQLHIIIPSSQVSGN